MWHPHFTRNWIDENNFIIVDIRRKHEEKFPIFLEFNNTVKEKKENKILSDFNKQMNSNNKMNCACKFVREEFASNNKNKINIEEYNNSSLIKRDMIRKDESIEKDYSIQKKDNVLQIKDDNNFFYNKKEYVKFSGPTIASDKIKKNDYSNINYLERQKINDNAKINLNFKDINNKFTEKGMVNKDFLNHRKKLIFLFYLIFR